MFAIRFTDNKQLFRGTTLLFGARGTWYDTDGQLLFNVTLSRKIA